MTISTEVRKAGPYIGNDTTKLFSFNYKIFNKNDLILVKKVVSTGIESELTLDVDYTVTINSNQDTNAGGVILLDVALATGETLTLISNVDNLQGMELNNLGGFNPEVLNDTADKTVIQLQQLNQLISRTPKVKRSSEVLDIEIEDPIDGKFVGYDSNLNMINITGLTASEITTITDNLQTQIDSNDSELSRTIKFDNPLSKSIDNPVATSFLRWNESGDRIINSDYLADAGSYILPYTNAIKRTQTSRNSERISVKDFGAIGDGSTDDTLSIQKAIDYLVTANGGTLFFPKGDYYISSTLSFTSVESLLITIEGDERYSTYITSANNIIAIDDNLGISIEKLCIRTIQYRTYGVVDSTGIGVKTSGRPTFSDLYIFGYGDCGIEASSPDRFINACFRNLRIQSCGNGINIEGTGVGNDFTTTSCIENTYIADCTYGMVFINASACYVNNVIIESCTNGALINGCANFTVYNWYFEQNTTPYSATNSSIVIINETISNNTNPPTITFSESILGGIAFPTSTINSSEISSGKLGIKGVTGATTSREENITYIEHQNIGTPRALKHTRRDSASGSVSTTGILPTVNGGTVTPSKSHNIFTSIIKGSTGGSFNPSTDVLSDDINISVNRPGAGVFEIVFNTGVAIDSIEVTPLQQYISYPPSKMLICTPSFFDDTAPHNNWTKINTTNGFVTKIRILIYDILGASFVDENFSVSISGRLNDE